GRPGQGPAGAAGARPAAGLISPRPAAHVSSGDRAMRIGMLTVRRRSLLAGAAAGLLCGCQHAGTQFATPGVARGDMLLGGPGRVPPPPAFAQIPAGQQTAARPPTAAPGQPMMMSAVPSYTGQPVIVGPPVMGSGGLVYPVAYVPASQLPAGTPTMVTSSS